MNVDDSGTRAPEDDWNLVHDTALAWAARNSSHLVRENAEDLAQDVVERFAKVSLEQEIENPAAWATTVTKNLALNLIRNRMREAGSMDDEDGDYMRAAERFAHAHSKYAASQQAINKQQVELLLSQLTPKQATLLLMVWDDWTQAEIAEALGYKNAATVASTLKQLRALVKENETKFEGVDPDWQSFPRIY